MNDSVDGDRSDGGKRTDDENATSTPLEEVIHARGHEHVSAEHASTFEISTDDFLTPAGDCILAIEADRAPADFDPEFVEACRNSEATITVALETDGHRDVVQGRGDPDLEFSSDRSAVGRTSEYVDERTIMLGAEHAAEGFDRELVAALADGADVIVTITVSRGGSE
ncbi:DUF371 domain-containing protein [Halostagnicola sp. A-GB9-2]|uniref:DUF371 domain-containing protein n=1 Tax=Halostagnicola sp. A-GB9-2 TaxID=3048066 RepID=UPI0024C05187|nr:DUF371 domain-containing protein [Halostagnicola sp. A-GB9-2]MDJ1431629.1 DUF371 domain-containing protein [Halostagnicola sp. A-GB9-2]